jgi:hypothetical protein
MTEVYKTTSFQLFLRNNLDIPEWYTEFRQNILFMIEIGHTLKKDFSQLSPISISVTRKFYF